MRILTRSTSILIALAICSLFLTISYSEEEAPEMRKLTVRTIDEDGKPIEGAQIHRSVWTKVKKFKSNEDRMTDANGEVTFVLPESVDTLRLWSGKEGFVPLFANFDARELGRDPVPESFTFTLSKGTEIGGIVLNGIGIPIQNARINVIFEGSDSNGDGQVVVNRWLNTGEEACLTDARGVWSANNIPAGNHHKIGIRLTHPDYVDDMTYEYRGLEENREFTLEDLRKKTAALVMYSGAKVSGKITAPDGSPIPNAMVIWGEGPYHNSEEQERFSDKKGVYQLPPIATSTDILTVVAKGFAPHLKKINLAPAEQNIHFEMKKGKTIRIVFLDEEKIPVPEVRVNVTGWQGTDTLFNWRHPNVPFSGIPDRADENGMYIWSWAPEEPVEFYFSRLGYEELRDKSLSPGEHTVILKKVSRPE